MSYMLINTTSDFLKAKVDLENQIRSYNESLGWKKWSLIESEPPCYPCALAVTSNFHYQTQFNFFPINNH